MTPPNPKSGRRKRIVINALHAKSGGGVTYLQNTLKYFAEDEDLEFHILLHQEQYDLFAPLPERIHLHLFDFHADFFGLLFWEQFAVPLLTRLMSADVTFSPANYGPLFAPNSVIMLRNALTVMGGEKRIRKRLYWAGVALMTLLSLAASRRSIAVSQYARHQLTFGIASLLGRKTTVVYHGVDKGFRVVRHADEQTPFMLSVSDIYIQKNLHGLVAALPRIMERFPDIRLKVAGRPNDADYLKGVRRQAAKLGVACHIDFLGHCSVETLRNLYSRCKVFVFPSTVETFGNALVEAMASGAPVASSKTAAMPEIAGDAALYFHPLDSDDIAEQVIRILEDPELAATLSQRGIERAAQYSWEATARQTCAVLRAAAGRRDRD